MTAKLDHAEITRFAKAYNKYGTIRRAAKATGCSAGKAASKRYQRALEAGLIEQPGAQVGTSAAEFKEPIVRGSVPAMGAREMPLPPPGKVQRYILTCAQNNTRLHGDVWANLLALADYYGDCEVMVSRFVYDKRWQADMDKDTFMRGGRGTRVDSAVVWDENLEPFLSDERVILAPGLVWCGEMNILPTAVRPLSGLESYTGRKSAIIPHVKLAMQSVASGKHEGTKIIYTTGTVTQRNYIKRKAGLKAEFHHCYGGLLVEVDSDGDWFVRQLNASKDGTIYDFDLCVRGGEVTQGHRVEAINWGDIHQVRLDDSVWAAAWGHEGRCMVDALKPRHQFIHDLLDFYARNHHERKNPHEMFRRYTEGLDSVEAEVRNAMGFLTQIVKLAPGDGDVVVVSSNHDCALGRWLQEADFRLDPPNAVFHLRAQLAVYEAIERGDSTFNLMRWAAETYVERAKCAGPKAKERLWPVRFLQDDESFIICHDAGGGIECGMHGHLGPNGARGSAAAFAKMGRRANVGHTHSAGIYDGVYTAGTSSLLDMRYNRGPSSWTHSHIVTYANGKRAIITIWNGKWKA